MFRMTWSLVGAHRGQLSNDSSIQATGHQGPGHQG